MMVSSLKRRREKSREWDCGESDKGLGGGSLGALIDIWQ